MIDFYGKCPTPKFKIEHLVDFMVNVGKYTAKTRVSPTQGLGFRVYGFRV